MNQALVTPNQIVAYNLRRARFLRGYSQEQAAEVLAPFLGERWSKATYSAAERSIENPNRVRRFDADDLVAFARAFELPVPFFLLPPGPEATDVAPLVAVPDGEPDDGLTPGYLIELLFKPDQIAERLAEAFGDSTRAGFISDDQMSPTQGRLGHAASLVGHAVIASRLRDVEVWRRNLLDLAGLLEGLEDEAVQALLTDTEKKKRSKP